MYSITRRTILKGGVALAGSLALPAIVRAQDAAIKVGSFFTLTGPQAPYGQAFMEGVRLAIAQVNASGGAGGRQLELNQADDKGDPTEAVAIAREMMGDGISILIGGHSTGASLAVMGALPATGALFQVIGASSTSITHEHFNTSTFRMYGNAHAIYFAQGQLMADTYPEIASWAPILPDTEYARSSWVAFQQGHSKRWAANGLSAPEYLQPEMVKFGAPDYRLQLGNLMSSSGQGLFCAIAGSDAVTFYGQGRAFGFTDKFGAIADTGTELSLGKALKDGIPPNLWSPTAWYYAGEPQTEEGTKLYEDYVAATQDKMPTGAIAKGHGGVLALAAAIAKAGTDDVEAVKTALADIETNVAYGKLKMRPTDHQAITDIEFIELSPDASSVDGWIVRRHSKLDGDSVVEPATPGEPLRYE